MSFEDNENLYTLNEDEKNREEGPKNYASYVYEDSQEDIEEGIENKEAETPKKSAFSLMLKILLSPVEGWKNLRRSRISIETLQSGCFYPLLALLALSNFADYLYSVNVNLSQVITKAVVAFVSFFFANFSIPVLLCIVTPKDMHEKIKGNYGKAYFIIALSTLAMFSFVTELLPMIWPILIFLPIWTIYLMFKGVRFFHFEQKQEMKFYIMSIVSVIGIPMLIDWIFNIIMPY